MSTVPRQFSFHFNNCVHQAYQIVASKVKMLAPSPDPFDESSVQPHRPVNIFDELSEIIDEADETSGDSVGEVGQTLEGSGEGTSLGTGKSTSQGTGEGTSQGTGEGTSQGTGQSTTKNTKKSKKRPHK